MVQLHGTYTRIVCRDDVGCLGYATGWGWGNQATRGVLRPLRGRRRHGRRWGQGLFFPPARPRMLPGGCAPRPPVNPDTSGLEFPDQDGLSNPLMACVSAFRFRHQLQCANGIIGKIGGLLGCIFCYFCYQITETPQRDIGFLSLKLRILIPSPSYNDFLVFPWLKTIFRQFSYDLFIAKFTIPEISQSASLRGTLGSFLQFFGAKFFTC